jgi:uroporphyrinogen-III synthase
MSAAPLAGRRVLVTRAIEDSGIWSTRLIALGAEAVILPCINTEFFHDEDTRTRLEAALLDADWLCITSARCADAVARLTDISAIQRTPPIRVAAVGGATAAAARTQLGCTPFVARGGTSRTLGEELLNELAPAPAISKIVVAGAEDGRTDLEEVLVPGGALVTRVNVYRTVPAERSGPALDHVAENISDVVLASPSAVQGWLNQVSSPGSVRIFTIGPTTSAAVTAAGFIVAGEAVHPTFDSLVEAMQ